MKAHCLFFIAPCEIELREIERPSPCNGELLVQTQVSAISPGTEMLIYRGQAPAELAADESIPSLDGTLAFPLQYGYASVGVVIEVGDDISSDWLGRRVFSFQPHQTHFLTTPNQVILLPKGISPDAAAFLPNMETAINLVMDGRPLIGERVVVFGQGIIGLLTTSLLARFPLRELLTLDIHANRRDASLIAGATGCFDPRDPGAFSCVRGESGTDLSIEISGSTDALDQAIAVTGYAGRVVIGSWYGQKRVSLDLGGYFHRSHIQIISSQVSRLDPSLTGRWDKIRRFDLVWEMLRQVGPQRWTTHRFPFHEAHQGYALLDQKPGETIQVLLDYTEN